jgi:hypothetical protein
VRLSGREREQDGITERVNHRVDLGGRTST